MPRPGAARNSSMASQSPATPEMSEEQLSTELFSLPVPQSHVLVPCDSYDNLECPEDDHQYRPYAPTVSSRTLNESRPSSPTTTNYTRPTTSTSKTALYSLANSRRTSQNTLHDHFHSRYQPITTFSSMTTLRNDSNASSLSYQTASVGNDSQSSLDSLKPDDNDDLRQTYRSYNGILNGRMSPLPTARTRRARPTSYTEWFHRPRHDHNASLSTLRGTPIFRPHPAVRPNYDVWSTASSEEIPIGVSARNSVLSAPPGTPLGPDQSTGMSKWHEYLFIFNVCLAQIFSLAGLAVSLAPVLIISRSFGVTDAGQMSWYTAAYSMTLGTFILPAGRLGDMFGHKKMFIIGWIWFAIWSLVCGFSYVGGPIMLSACRGMQGIGPALLVPNGIALVGRTFPIGFKRAMAIAIFGGCGPVGFTLGTVFSALLAQLLWWPWSFWITAIACTLIAVMTYFVIPSDASRAPPAGPEKNPREPFDLLGTATGVSGLILINFALNEAPLEGWDHYYIPILLAVGCVTMALFVWIELKVADRPIVPLRGLHKDAAFTLACIAAGWASHGIWLYYLFLFLENVRGLLPLTAAAETWPVAPIGLAAAVAVPFILKKIRVPYLMSVAMAVFLAGLLLLIFAPVHQSYYLNTMISVIIMPFAMNWSFPSGTILMSNAVAKQHQGIAASLITTMVNYSIATGLGIAGTLDRYLTPIHGVHGGYVDAWWLGVALAGTGLLISFYFIWQTRPGKRLVAK